MIVTNSDFETLALEKLTELVEAPHGVFESYEQANNSDSVLGRGVVVVVVVRSSGVDEVGVETLGPAVEVESVITGVMTVVSEEGGRKVDSVEGSVDWEVSVDVTEVEVSVVVVVEVVLGVPA